MEVIWFFLGFMNMRFIRCKLGKILIIMFFPCFMKERCFDIPSWVLVYAFTNWSISFVGSNETAFCLSQFP